MNREIRIMSLENRLSKLSNKPIVNANLIRKAKRQIRNLQK